MTLFKKNDPVVIHKGFLPKKFQYNKIYHVIDINGNYCLLSADKDTIEWFSEDDLYIKFSIDDKVINKDTLKKGIIISRSYFLNTEEYLVEYEDNSSKWEEYNNLNYVKPNTNDCECGATYTSFKDHHLFYCPKFKGKKK